MAKIITLIPKGLVGLDEVEEVADTRAYICDVPSTRVQLWAIGQADVLPNAGAAPGIELVGVASTLPAQVGGNNRIWLCKSGKHLLSHELCRGTSGSPNPYLV